MSSPESRLLELLDCVLDGSGSDSEHQEFAQLVEDHHELTPELVEQLRTHSLLQWQCDQVNVPLASEVNAEAVQEVRRRPAPFRPRVKRFEWGWAAAAAVVIGAGLGIWQFASWWEAQNGALAQVVDGQQAKWSDSSTALAKGRLIYPGRLDLVSGSSKLEFRSGATVAIEGPTSLRIDSDMLVRLDRGMTTAYVPQEAKGFTIKTPVAEIVDRGTRFRVTAREDGATEVVVYEGEVDLRPSASLAQFQLSLRAEEAARINNRGSVDRLVHFHRNLEGDQWTNVQPLPVKTIERVWDSLWSTAGESYYLVSSRGLADDSVAYVDQPHQWNGLSADGLPKELERADYVRMFNDYRYMADLEVFVELTRPAMLYVFYDNRSPAPPWLAEHFENTGLKVGLDEGPWGEGMSEHAVADGPGESVDNVFTVWQRRCERVGTYKLGAMTKTSEARAMYGIAATPLE